MRIMFVHTEQYTAWNDELFYNLVRGPILDCGMELEVQDFVRNHRDKNFDLAAEGAKLFAEVQKFMPTLLVYSHSWYDVPNEWLAKIRQLGVKILTIMWDSLVDTPNSEINIAKITDYLAVCDSVSNYTRYRLLFEYFREPAAKVIFISGFHVLPQVFQKKPTEKTYDVTLLGSAEGHRLTVLKYLENALADTNISFNKLGGLVNSEKGCFSEGLTDGWLPLDKYIEIINKSKIMITSQTRIERIQVKGKVFEFMSCGAFCLVDHNKEYEQLIPDQYVGYYHSLPDMVEKIKYYLANDAEREAIAAAGHEWYRRNFNYKTFWTGFLNHVINPDIVLPNIPTLENSYQRIRNAHGDLVARNVMASINTTLNPVLVPEPQPAVIVPERRISRTRIKSYLKRKTMELKELF